VFLFKIDPFWLADFLGYSFCDVEHFSEDYCFSSQKAEIHQLILLPCFSSFFPSFCPEASPTPSHALRLTPHTPAILSNSQSLSPSIDAFLQTAHPLHQAAPFPFQS
jgi:hypothetical protein